MTIEELRAHYATLSSEALLALHEESLSQVARKCWHEELARRGLSVEPRSDDERIPPSSRVDFGPEPPWIEEAARVNGFTVRLGNEAAYQAARVRDVLVNAGIPCHIATTETYYEATEAGSAFDYDVMVPGDSHLLATSVLDREIYNPEAEELWRVHLGDLTDNQLLALDETALVGGLADRIARMKRVYVAEMTRRGFTAKPWTV